ncbi:MAG: hypothetical protein ACU84H_02280 [Gammaproteobacteria bacterium]
MRKTIIEIYALAVCFFSVACLVITLGIALYDLVGIAAPAFTLDTRDYERHQSDQAFLESGGTTTHIVRVEGGERREEIRSATDSANLPKKREESFQRALKTEQRSAGQSLVRSTIIMIIASIVFMIHWRLAKLSQREGDA